MLSERRLARFVLAASLGIFAGTSLADWTHIGPLKSHTVQGPVLTLNCDPGVVRLEAVADGVVRVRLSPDGKFPTDFSWAVVDLKPRGSWQIAEEAGALKATAQGLVVEVAGSPCRLSIRDSEGVTLVADEPARGMAWAPADSNGTAPVNCWQTLPADAGIYGLAEKSGQINKRGQTQVMWNTDAYAYGPSSDPIYASVPFYMIRQRKNFCGVFFDNPWRSHFDFGRIDQQVTEFGADGGELNYYVIAGPSSKDVLNRYTELTGRMELPPKWALGYHQCKYSYYPESRVREVAEEFRKRQIPCDVLWFDIDYMDGYRCFTWDRERFPDPLKMDADLQAMGFKTVAIIDPGVKNQPGYFVFDEGDKIPAWLTKPDGKPYIGKVWPGECTFPDFTSDRVREWWAGLHPKFLEESGLDGIWNDMNEPADFIGPYKTVPVNLRHDNAGNPASHRACHNVYGMQMARAARDGLLKANPNLRPFTLTRASYAGGQRYSALWTGDNQSTWEHMSMSLSMALNLGLAGMPFVGPDIGGFGQGATPELFARWIQFGALMPFSRVHTSSNNPDQEPWSFGPEVEAAAKKAIERRYAWMPYIYTLFEEASRTGVPVVRPVWMESDDAPGWVENSEFFLGSDILVAPLLRPEQTPQRIYLPEGVWFDGNTGLIHGGKRSVTVPGGLDVLPHFFRAGAIVPMQSVVQHAGEEPESPLILDVWPWGQSSGTLYEDDGATLAFRQGAIRRTRFDCVRNGDEVKLTVRASEGTYVPTARKPIVRIHGFDENAKATSTGLTWAFDRGSRSWTATLPDDGGKGQEVTVRFASPTSATPPALTFSEKNVPFEFLHHVSTSEVAGGVATLHVRRPDSPYVVLPRMNVAADKNPILQIRMSTEHASKLVVRYASEESPEKLSSEKIEFPLTPDGEMHDYSFDLTKPAGATWRGTVFYVELHWRDGTKPDETIRLERIAFAPQ